MKYWDNLTWYLIQVFNDSVEFLSKFFCLYVNEIDKEAQCFKDYSIIEFSLSYELRALNCNGMIMKKNHIIQAVQHWILINRSVPVTKKSIMCIAIILQHLFWSFLTRRSES